MKHWLLALTLTTAVTGLCGAARAASMYSNLTDWKAAAGAWTETTSFGVPDGTVVSGVTLADGTALTFGQPLQTAALGSGWSTWSGGYAGSVLESYGTGSYTTETWSISPVSGFGLFLEPDPFSVYNITLTTSAGDILTQAVDGNGGALFFGWVGSGITGLTISSDVDFAAGDFFSSGAAPVPEPSYLPCMLVLGAVAALFLRFRRKAVRV